METPYELKQHKPGPIMGKNREIGEIYLNAPNPFRSVTHMCMSMCGRAKSKNSRTIITTGEQNKYITIPSNLC